MEKKNVCCLGNLKEIKILEKKRIARAMKIRNCFGKICEGILADFVNKRRMKEATIQTK